MPECRKRGFNPVEAMALFRERVVFGGGDTDLQGVPPVPVPGIDLLGLRRDVQQALDAIETPADLGQYFKTWGELIKQRAQPDDPDHIATFFTQMDRLNTERRTAVDLFQPTAVIPVLSWRLRPNTRPDDASVSGYPSEALMAVRDPFQKLEADFNPMNMWDQAHFTVNAYLDVTQKALDALAVPTDVSIEDAKQGAQAQVQAAGLRSLVVPWGVFMAASHWAGLGRSVEAANTTLQQTTGWEGGVLGLDGAITLSVGTVIMDRSAAVMFPGGSGAAGENPRRSAGLTLGANNSIGPVWQNLGHEWFHAVDHVLAPHAFENTHNFGLRQADGWMTVEKWKTPINAAFRVLGKIGLDVMAAQGMNAVLPHLRDQGLGAGGQAFTALADGLRMLGGGETTDRDWSITQERWTRLLPKHAALIEQEIGLARSGAWTDRGAVKRMAEWPATHGEPNPDFLRSELNGLGADRSFLGKLTANSVVGRASTPWWRHLMDVDARGQGVSVPNVGHRYYSALHEVAARSFDRCLPAGDKMATSGHEGPDIHGDKIAERSPAWPTTFPKSSEVPGLQRMFGDFFETLKPAWAAHRSVSVTAEVRQTPKPEDMIDAGLGEMAAAGSFALRAERQRLARQAGLGIAPEETASKTPVMR